MSESKLHQVWLGLGANLGDRARNLAEALNQLGRHVTVERVSLCYETEPWGMTDRPRFVNLLCCDAGQAPLLLNGFAPPLQSING